MITEKANCGACRSLYHGTGCEDCQCGDNRFTPDSKTPEGVPEGAARLMYRRWHNVHIENSSCHLMHNPCQSVGFRVPVENADEFRY